MEKYGEPWKMAEPITLVIHAHIGYVERKEWLLAKWGLDDTKMLGKEETRSFYFCDTNDADCWLFGD